MSNENFKKLFSYCFVLLLYCNLNIYNVIVTVHFLYNFIIVQILIVQTGWMVSGPAKKLTKDATFYR